MENDNFYPNDHPDPNQNQSGNGQNPYHEKPPLHDMNPNEEQNIQVHSPGMATASLVLGIISLVVSCCFYISLPLGALSIILGILSKGSSQAVSSQGKTGIVLAIIGICMTILLTISILFTYITSGTFQKELKNYMRYYNTHEYNSEDWPKHFGGNTVSHTE